MTRGFGIVLILCTTCSTKPLTLFNYGLVGAWGTGGHTPRPSEQNEHDGPAVSNLKEEVRQ